MELPDTFYLDESGSGPVQIGPDPQHWLAEYQTGRKQNSGEEDKTIVVQDSRLLCRRRPKGGAVRPTEVFLSGGKQTVGQEVCIL